MSGITPEDLKVLKAEFEADRIGVKVQSFSKERTRAQLVLYLQHIDVMDRLDQVDPDWKTEVLHEDTKGQSVYVRMRMTVKGISRENVGEGGDPKGAYSDALKRCAMLYGVGRFLYDAPNVWVPYDEAKDKYREWTMADYSQALGGKAPGKVESKGDKLTQALGKPKAPEPDPDPKPTDKLSPEEIAQFQKTFGPPATEFQDPSQFKISIGFHAGKFVGMLSNGDLLNLRKFLVSATKVTPERKKAHLEAIEAVLGTRGVEAS